MTLFDHAQNGNGNHNGSRAAAPAPVDPPYQDAIERSAIDPQHIVTQTTGWDTLGETLLMGASAVADGIRPWGVAPALRDRQLRAFITQEPFTQSALASVVARNVGLSWLLDGPSAVVSRVQDVFHDSEFGQGWESLWTKVGWDYETQDKGGFIEFVRDEDRPEAPVVMMNHLDAGRCWHTGNPRVPVLYQDRLGRWHAMKWWQCQPISEMPAPHETLYGLQYCALTRILVISQTLRNILKFQEERSGGRWTKALHIISGVKKQETEDALESRQREADNFGLTRFSLPAILTTTDPDVKPTLLTIALASLPDEWNMDEYMKWYLTAMSMGLLIDYQELAPMPGHSLGSGQQSETLNRKSNTKGKAIYTNRVEHLFNFFGVCPRNVTFKFDDKDLEEDTIRATVFETYATAFTSLMGSQIVDAQASLDMLLSLQLMDQDVYDALQERIKAKAAEDKKQADADAANLAAMQRAGVVPQPGVPGQPVAAQPASSNIQAQDGESVASARAPVAGTVQAQDGESVTAQRGMTTVMEEPRAVVEGRLTRSAHRALVAMAQNVVAKLEE